ncbi:MAG: cell division protein FtsQ/DivIB [Phycisphaerae bacterium]
MAVRRKKRKSNTKRIAFKLGKRKSKITVSPSSIGVLKVLAVICVFAALGVGFVFLDRYVKKVAPAWGKTVDVELIEPPAWVNQSLRDEIIAAATVGGEDVKLDEDVVRLIQSNLVQKVAWLQKVKVRTAHDKILIEADYRKPIALVKSGLRKFYVDAELVVLDFVPMPNLPIVVVKGLSPVTKIPPVGKVWQREDLAAAVAILARLDRMDKLVTPDKPLLYEIDSIDVSNFKGREDSRFAHIILYTKDNTEIIWGAEIGTWSRHLEAKDEEKLAKLYNYYKQQGSLLGGAKYINLRDPQDTIPLPIDKY